MENEGLVEGREEGLFVGEREEGLGEVDLDVGVADNEGLLDREKVGAYEEVVEEEQPQLDPGLSPQLQQQ